MSPIYNHIYVIFYCGGVILLDGLIILFANVQIIREILHRYYKEMFFSLEES